MDLCSLSRIRQNCTQRSLNNRLAIAIEQTTMHLNIGSDTRPVESVCLKGCPFQLLYKVMARPCIGLVAALQPAVLTVLSD